MTPGIVLAAGASSRMGTPKALLRAGDDTFARRILATLRHGGVTRTVLVIRPGLDAHALDIGDLATVVVNPDPESGQLSSLLAGLAVVDPPGAGLDGVLVTLVDMPFITPDTVRALLDRAAVSPASILRATYDGRHGHPVIFKRDVFSALRAADPALGAKAVFGRFTVEDVPVPDPGAVEDVDTPADLARLVNPPPPNSL